MWLPQSFLVKEEPITLESESNGDAWLMLLMSGLFEAVWATALGSIDDTHRALPIFVFIFGVVISMGGLGWAMRSLPTGTAYAVWTAVGGVTTVGTSVIRGSELLTVTKSVFIMMIICGVVGLKTESE